jgi:hypothetical protein
MFMRRNAMMFREVRRGSFPKFLRESRQGYIWRFGQSVNVSWHVRLMNCRRFFSQLLAAECTRKQTEPLLAR